MLDAEEVANVYANLVDFLYRINFKTLTYSPCSEILASNEGRLVKLRPRARDRCAKSAQTLKTNG